MIPLIKPIVGFDMVADDIRAILESGQLTSGPYVAAFEAELAAYLGVSYALTTTSATTALHLTMVALGIGAGDEVLVSDFTFPASGNAIVQTGATPVPVDCHPGSFVIDPDHLEQRITNRSKAVMVVHPFGQPADMARINRVARKHGLKVIEDAACALGAVSEEGLCGAVSDVGCFSFHPRKLLTTGEGGAISTNNADLARSLQVLRNHGGVREEVGLSFIEHGFNYRMSEIQACLGRAQLMRFDDAMCERRRKAQIYLEYLQKMKGIDVPLSAALECCTFQSFVLLLDDGLDRNSIIRRLKENGIESTLGTYAMHAQPVYKRYGYKPGDLPHSWRNQQQSLTLPLYDSLTEQEIELIVTALAREL